MGAKDKKASSAKQPTQAEKDLAGAGQNVWYNNNVNVAGMPKADSAGSQAHWDFSGGGGAAKESGGAANVLFPNDRVVDNEPEVFEIFIDEITGAETPTHHANGSEVDADELTKNIQLAFKTMHKRVGEMEGGKKPWQLGEFHLGFEKDDKPVFDVGRMHNDVKSSISKNNSDTPNTGKLTGDSHDSITKHIAKMMRDPITRHALEKASSATGVSIESLMTMAIIESGGNRNIGTNKYGYTGLMQLGKVAVGDIQKTNHSITYEGVKKNAEMNSLAGAIYWNQNSKNLRDNNISNTILNQYLAHQQGAGGLQKLLNTLKAEPNAPITKNQSKNLPETFIKAHHGNVTQQEFYNYWENSINNIQSSVHSYMINH